MTSRIWLKTWVISGLCAVMCTGCFGRKGKNDPLGSGGFEPGGDIVDIGAVGGEGMAPRWDEEGERVDVSFESVRFAYDSFQLADSEVRKIEAVADYMGRTMDVRLVSEGHCDERGSREYNMSLGEHRALAVRAYLVGLGIEGSRIQTRSYGEEQPVDPGHNESAWQLNRRVEFIFYR